MHVRTIGSDAAINGIGLLGRLSQVTLDAIWPRMIRIECARYEILTREDEVIANVYFPVSGWISMIAHLEGGRSAEVGIVGSEGMVGLPVLFGGNRSSTEWMVQAPGTFLKLDAAAFRWALGDHPDLKALLLKYALTFQEQVAQTAACNISHNLEQRMARWLLLVHDRSGDELPVTQDLLAMMLGVRRAGVSEAAGALQRGGVIQYHRGRLRITDRARLEAVACECYVAVKRRSEQLLGPG